MTIKTTTYWFFIRGLMREATHWEDFPRLFENSLPNSKVITLDLPGSGTRWSTQSPLTVSEMAQMVRSQALNILDKEAVKTGKRPQAYVMAISLGGMVALEWLQQFPEDLKGGVFINISLSGINPFYKRLKPQAWAQLIDIVFTRDTKIREKKVLNLTTSHFNVQESHLNNRVLAYEKHPATKSNFFRQFIAATRFKPNLKTISSPILLLNSLGDRLVDSSCSVAIGSKWNWQLKTHPTANHDLPLEDPDWVISKVKDWLSKIN